MEVFKLGFVKKNQVKSNKDNETFAKTVSKWHFGLAMEFWHSQHSQKLFQNFNEFMHLQHSLEVLSGSLFFGARH